MLVALDREVTPSAQRALAVGLLTAITIIHGCFLKTGICMQNALGWIKIGLMAFMAVLGVAALFLPHPSAHAGATTLSPARLFEGSHWNPMALSTAFSNVFYSFAGYDNVNNVLNEVKNPVRTLKTMAATALLSVALFYLTLNIAYFLVVSLEEIENSGELVAALFFQKIFGVGFASRGLPVLVALSAAGNVKVVTFTLVKSTLFLYVPRCRLNVLRPGSIKKSLGKASYPLLGIRPLLSLLMHH